VTITTLAPETRVDDYVVRALVGEGSMALVYDAVHAPTNERAALKVLRAPLARDEAIARRFARESESLRSLLHPHVVRVRDIGVHGTLPYFAMDFVAGGTVNDALERDPSPWSVDALLAFGAAIAGALDAIHARGLVHRDISAANVMLTAERVPILLDFGIAIKEGDTRLTKRGSILGTASYLAPELTRGAVHASPASDQYAFGVLLYRLASGKFPFEGKSVYEIMTQIATKPAPSLDIARPNLPPWIHAAIDRMLASKPSARWPRIEDALVRR